MDFEMELKKLRKEYLNPHSGKNVDRLQRNLEDINNIMRGKEGGCFVLQIVNLKVRFFPTPMTQIILQIENGHVH